MKSSPEDLHQIDVPFPDHGSVITHGNKTIVSIKKTLSPGVIQEFGFNFDISTDGQIGGTATRIRKHLS